MHLMNLFIIVSHMPNNAPNYAHFVPVIVKEKTYKVRSCI